MKRIWLLTLSAAAGVAAVMAAQPPSTNPYAKFLGPNRSLTLDEAVEFAVQNNTSILTAEQEIFRTQGLVIQVRAQALPQLNLASSYAQEEPRLASGGAPTSSSGSTSTASTSGTTGSLATSGTAAAPKGSSGSGGSSSTSIQNKSWNVTVEASQLLYSGGQVDAALKIAKLTESSTFFSLRDTVDTVIDNVRKQFYAVLLDRALITVQEESVKLLADQLKDQQSRFDAGTVPRFNVLQAEVALINQQPVLIQARNNYKIAELTLARSMNINFDPNQPDYVPFEAVGDLNLHVENFDLNNALAQAKANRWFLKVQRQTINIDIQNIRVQLAGYQPRLEADAGYEVVSDPFSDSLGRTVNGYFIGVTGDWAIFDGGATYGLVKQARAQLEEARVNYDDAEHNVELQVQTAFLALEVARETLESQTKGVELAVEALRLASERLAAGAGVQLDVLDSQVALTTARSTELQARAGYLEAIADFDMVTAVETKWAEAFDNPVTRRQKWNLRQKDGSGTPRAEIYNDGKKPGRGNAD